MVDDELAGAEDLGAPSGGGNLKTYIIIAVIALVMGLIGFLAGKMFSGGGEKEKPAIEKKTDQPAADVKQDNGDQKTGENQGDDAANDSSENGENTQQGNTKASTKNKRGVLVLDVFTVNLNDPFGRRYIEIVLNLILERKDQVLMLKENELLMPKIRHEIFMTISSKSYNDLRGTSGKVTLYEEVMMRVNEICKEELGIEPVVEVLQTKFLIQ